MIRRLSLLDTNILVHLVRGDAVGRRIQAEYAPMLADPRPLISVVTEGELRSLALQFGWGGGRLEQARFLLGYFQRVSLDDTEILSAYAVIDAHSGAAGRAMGKNDVWIAATAHVLGAHLLTTDRDFDHLDPLFFPHTRIDPDAESKASVP